MLDKIIIAVDNMVKALTIEHTSIRSHPDDKIPEGELSQREKKHALGLMRVNHSGEICAQALYQGQAITARDKENAEVLEHAAHEEIEHLAWTKSRIQALGGKPSMFNPLFYLGSFAIGTTAGLFGDKWSLGFLAETEDQVEAHLGRHLNQLPQPDAKSAAVVTQMREDEAGHATMARGFGAEELPNGIKILMKYTSKVMTKIAYRV